MLDWNWFFSSISQSSAAIVGIFGAFIITKIVNSQIQFKKNSNLIVSHINHSKYLKDKVNYRYIDWYNKTKRKNQLEKISERIDEEDQILSANKYYLEHNFSIFDNRNLIIEKINEVIEESRNSQPSNHLSSLISNSVVTSPASIQANLQTNQNLVDEEEAVYDLIAEIRKHIRSIENFLSQIKNNPESSSLITFSIIISLLLFWTGVILPILFLPLPIINNISWNLICNDIYSVKGIIILCISVIFSLVMIVFFVINLRLKYCKEKIKELNHFTKLENYSIYFENMNDNNEYLNEHLNE